MTRSSKTFTLFVVALVLGVGATWLANRWLQNRLMPTAEADMDANTVVVAALEIPFGQKIEAAHLKLLPWPNDSLPDGAFLSTPEVEGRIANQRIMKGELILQQRVVEEVNGSTLSAILTPGMRALTVRVNDVIGVGGFLLPGNRVDIYASRKASNRRAYTKIILEDLKVLAVDQTASTDTDKPVVVRAVTLEVDPKEAEKLVQATQAGTVQLALRNPLDDEEVIAKVAPKPKKKIRVKKPVDSSFGAITVIRGTTVDKSKTRL
jgi:pilus assembly protein CpaB